jgi:hypothetical protein
LPDETNFSKVLHPYYKLAYIKVAWGGPEEQAAEIRCGNLDAKDWQDEARKIIEKTVSHSPPLRDWNDDYINQMAQYYTTRPTARPQQPPPTARPQQLPPTARPQQPPPTAVDADVDHAPVLSEFDRLRETLLTDDVEEGWASELRRYLGSMQRDVSKDTDLVVWWQVSLF